MKPLSREKFIAHLAKSATATKLGINNEIPVDLLVNANYLFDHYRFITDKLGFPGIYITSGYRCPKLNKAVGGVPGSRHCSCSAFDFAFSNVVSKLDFHNSVNLLHDNFCDYMMHKICCSASYAESLFRRHFILYPDRLFVHYQSDFDK